MRTLRTVGEFAAAVPRCIPVFERLRIDFWCRGEQTIQQACREIAITPSELLHMVDLEPEPAAPRTWERASLREMIAFIAGRHHHYTRQTLEALDRMSRKVRDRYGDAYPEVAELARVVADLMDDLLPHMFKEEQVLFPQLERLEGGGEAAAIEASLRKLEREHRSAAGRFAEVRELTRDYTLPADASSALRGYYALLHELERDLRIHLHLENNVLFPRAVELARNTPAGAV